jgi:hypothetical protein
MTIGLCIQARQNNQAEQKQGQDAAKIHLSLRFC